MQTPMVSMQTVSQNKMRSDRRRRVAPGTPVYVWYVMSASKTPIGGQLGLAGSGEYRFLDKASHDVVHASLKSSIATFQEAVYEARTLLNYGLERFVKRNRTRSIVLDTSNASVPHWKPCGQLRH